MPSWNQLLNKFDSLPNEKVFVKTLRSESLKRLREIGRLRGNRHVIFYSSAFLQKPQAPADRLQITHEDVNAFMSVMFGMTWSKNLTLLLHTPGGVTNAAETIVAYLRSKFTDIEVIVPTYAMSAGTMISLAANRIVMGRQSQLGPIDPQFLMGQQSRSPRAPSWISSRRRRRRSSKTPRRLEFGFPSCRPSGQRYYRRRGMLLSTASAWSRNG